MMMKIGGFLKTCLVLIFGSGLDNYLVSRLFYVEKSNKKGFKRKQVILRQSIFCKRNKEKHQMLELGVSRIERELDLVHLIRQLFLQKVSRRLNFSHNQRYLMRHQYRPFVLASGQQISCSSSEKFDHEQEDPVTQI